MLNFAFCPLVHDFLMTLLLEHAKAYDCDHLSKKNYSLANESKAKLKLLEAHLLQMKWFLKREL